MGRLANTDFVLDTIGRCFICLNELPHQIKLELVPIGSSYIHSLQHLSRYLKIKMKKVFHDNEDASIPEHLLDKVERSNLKASLCDRCATWNDKLSELYRQLEKIELETASYLQLVHNQLLEADQQGRSDMFRTFDNCDSEDGLTGKLKLEIAEAVRRETMQKCSVRLNVVKPKIKIQKLSKREIYLRTSRSKTRTSQNHKDTIHPRIFPTATSKIGDDDVKSEFQNDYEASDDFGNDDSGDFRDLGEQCEDSYFQPDFPTATIEYVELGPHNNVSTSKYKHLEKSETGKFICKLCYKEFSAMSGFFYHYQNVHLKIRFQCQICNKLFSKKCNLTKHQRSVHHKQRAHSPPTDSAGKPVADIITSD